jgi:hypothetical protein
VLCGHRARIKSGLLDCAGGPRVRAYLVVELAVRADGAVRDRLRYLLAREIHAPAFPRVVPPTIALLTPKRQDKHMAVVLLLFQEMPLSRARLESPIYDVGVAGVQTGFSSTTRMAGRGIRLATVRRLALRGPRTWSRRAP